MDIDQGSSLLHAACDEGSLVEVDAQSGKIRQEWPLAGGPDATFFNPKSGVVHVAIGDPGLIQSVHPRTGDSKRFVTAIGATTMALIEPEPALRVFSLAQGSSRSQRSLGKIFICTPTRGRARRDALPYRR